MKKANKKRIGAHLPSQFIDSWNDFCKKIINQGSDQFRKKTKNELIGEALSEYMKTHPIQK